MSHFVVTLKGIEGNMFPSDWAIWMLSINIKQFEDPQLFNTSM